MLIEKGLKFDGVRAVRSSQRWEVAEVDHAKQLVKLRMVAERVGPAPEQYVQNHRLKDVVDRFAGWPLEPIPDGREALEKWIDIETLVKGSDYVPALEGSTRQDTLF